MCLFDVALSMGCRLFGIILNKLVKKTYLFYVRLKREGQEVRLGREGREGPPLSLPTHFSILFRSAPCLPTVLFNWFHVLFDVRRELPRAYRVHPFACMSLPQSPSGASG